MQSDPEGGIPSGSLEVLGVEGTWRLKASSQAVDDYRYSQTMFRPDVVPCFIGFVRVRRSIRLSWSSSGRQTVDAGAPEQVRELLACIEHSGLHRALRDADDRADLFNRLLVIVDEVDDLAVRRR